jgi:hypothetical protein
MEWLVLGLGTVLVVVLSKLIGRTKLLRDYRIRHAPTFKELVEEARKGEKEGWTPLEDLHDLRLGERPMAVLATGRMCCEIWRRTGDKEIPCWTFVARLMDKKYEWTIEYIGDHFASASVGGLLRTSKVGSADLSDEEFVRLGEFAFCMVRAVSG